MAAHQMVPLPHSSQCVWTKSEVMPHTTLAPLTWELVIIPPATPGESSGEVLVGQDE